MPIRVLYKDNTYDIISAFTLQRLIESGKVSMFYRYSEKRWVSISGQQVRTRNRVMGYVGSERRLSGQAVVQPF